MGGNVIENGLFNRSKYKYRQPSTPMLYIENLYPDFETVIYEDLETIIGSGSMNGEDTALESFRGLYLFGGLVFDITIEIDGIVYSGSTSTLIPFSGYSEQLSGCTSLTDMEDIIPLVCGYSGTTNPWSLFIHGDTVANMKAEWISTLNGIIDQINASTEESGHTLTAEYFTDIDGIEKVKFIVILNDYYGRTGYETFEYYFSPIYNIQKQSCSLLVTGTTIANTSFAEYAGDCQLGGTVRFYFDQYIGDEMGNWPIYAYKSCNDTVNPFPFEISGCTYVLPYVLETDKYDLIFADAANCEQKIGVDGLQLYVYEPDGFPGQTGYTANAKLAYKPTFNYGLHKGSVVYSGDTVPTTYEDLSNKISNNEFIEVLVEDILTGDTLLSMTQKSYSEMTAQDFKNATINGYQFAFDYDLITVMATTCLSTTKSCVINESFEVLPTSKVFVYTNIDINLQTIPYRFDWKCPQDIYVKPTDGSGSGDYIIDYLGFPIEVTGVTLDYCANKIYYQIYYSGHTGTNILINGNLNPDNKIIVSYGEEVVESLDFNLFHFYNAPGYDESSPVNVQYQRNPSSDDLPCDIVLPTPSLTPTVTKTPTKTPTVTKSITPTKSVTPTITPTKTPTITPSKSLSATKTPTVTPTKSITPTKTVTPTKTMTPTITPTKSVTPTVTRTVTPTVTPTPVYFYVLNSMSSGSIDSITLAGYGELILTDGDWPILHGEDRHAISPKPPGTYTVVVWVDVPDSGDISKVEIEDSDYTYHCHDRVGDGMIISGSIVTHTSGDVSLTVSDEDCDA
jgi:hypothetical protein